ncbi:MAG: FAD-dependent oxidoreductase [Chloroflexota bacterium]|nr:FAD-dependent oxidoreductase [Chloroflexota bacterium]MDE3192699.1 FAD-dependent oxidoreductase [Chloroflexota bacterium]
MSAQISSIVADHASVSIDEERCAGCQECVIRCPTHALAIDTERWIADADDELCVGCRQCERVCPYSAIAVTGPRIVAPRIDDAPLRPDPLDGDRRETRSGFAGWPEALREAERCLACPDPTCMEGCPAHNDIPGFIAAVRQRDLVAAADVLSRSTMLPGVCSRVCDQSVQCEGACSWALAGGQAVSIGRLERFVADRGPEPRVQRASVEGAGLSVAIVGSGPAGQAAAWELLAASARVTMLEKDAEPGGVLRWGIPSFTLPAAVRRGYLDALVAAGLVVTTGRALGRDVAIDDLLADHDAVILAHGASTPLRLPVSGMDLPGVEDATACLERAKPALESGGQPQGYPRGIRVLVLGGGNTAMDVARTLRRSGAEVTAVEWMDERFARVRPDELADARAEGVDVRFTTTVDRLEGDAQGVRTAWLRRTVQRLSTKPPVVVPGAPEPLAVDRVVVALGYRVDRAVAGSVVDLPLRVDDRARTFPDRRWIASGIPTGPALAVGTQALQREAGLAVAASAVHSGWWVRLWQREPRARSRAEVWGQLWRRQEEAAAAEARAPRAERVWVVGDALVGPATVVGAMAQGRAAARAVLHARPARTGS